MTDCTCRYCTDPALADVDKPHVLFVGRWQPCHLGHVMLWMQGAWKHKHPASIYVRDIPPDENNPFTTEQTVGLIQKGWL